MTTPLDPGRAPNDFLLEIGVEELPAAAARAAAAQAGPLALGAFANRNIPCGSEDVAVWVTPRRIAVFIKHLAPMQEAQEVAERGPIKAKAFDEDGNPTKAAEGFARAKKVAVEDLQVREHEGQEFVFAVHSKEAKRTYDLLPEVCGEIIHGISFSKTMRWEGDFHFSRPVRWLVARYGHWNVEFQAAGVKSGNESRGHRFLAPQPVVIEEPADYARLLAESKVTVDQEQRRELILTGLATEAAKLEGRFIDPAGELEEVLYLVENPSVLPGAFGEEHLRLPDRVLITCMQSHQRYFPLTDESGRLINRFLYVMNSDPACAAEITEGNERVLEGRIEDAEFSFDKDLDTGIEVMVQGLDNVVFHGKLGTLADKSHRLQSLVECFSGIAGLSEADRKAAAAAARLAKADQVSIMVQEFPTLEGYIGSVYAEMEGYPSDVCRAVEEHFMPTAAGGELPSTLPGAALAICDKADNLMGAFGVNELPTGSKDPYGLRRAAAGLTAISERYGIDFDLPAFLKVSRELFIGQKAGVSTEPGLAAAAYDFVCDRIQHAMVEKGMPVEIVEAARAASLTSTLRLTALTQALDGFRKTPEFEDLHTAYFRSSKIAAKAGKGAGEAPIDEQLFEEEAERELAGALASIEPEVIKLSDARQYPEALQAAAALRAPVDRFFDDVLIIAKDEAVRENRLALVKKVANLILSLGDPMRVAAAPKNGQKEP